MKAIEQLILRDPGRRNVAAFARAGELERAARSLLEGRGRALICTGFPVVHGQVGEGFRWPETDGPGGATAIGDALRALGREVIYVCGPNTAELLYALGVPADAVRVGTELRPADSGTAAKATELLEACAPVGHVVSVEVPGRAMDGRYYGMLGSDITGSVCALDALMLLAGDHGAATVGIGDGGNEAGMGGLREAVIEAVPHGETIASVVAADFAVVAGTSTWGALGLVAALSALAGRDLLPSEAAFTAGLEAIVAKGALDGMSGLPEAKIDGLPLEETLGLLRELRRSR